MNEDSWLEQAYEDRNEVTYFEPPYNPEDYLLEDDFEEEEEDLVYCDHGLLMGSPCGDCRAAQAAYDFAGELAQAERELR
jgi:hypothetical protein